MSYVFSSLERHQKVAAFLATAVLFLGTHQIVGINKFQYDAELYWYLATQLANFPATYRGYFAALIFFPFRAAGDLFPIFGFMPFRIGSSLIYSFIYTVTLPGFFISIFGGYSIR